MKSLVCSVAAAITLVAAFPACAMTFTVKSSSYQDGATMPQKLSYNQYGCTGQNLSPDLAWLGVPTRTKSFAVTMHDPDAPHTGGWWHWVAFDIAGGASGLKLGAGDPSKGLAPTGTVEGTNDFGSPGYGGPCPPPGDAPHHYVLTIYALDVASVGGLDAKTTGPQLLKAIDGHILGKAVLVGRFGR